METTSVLLTGIHDNYLQSLQQVFVPQACAYDNPGIFPRYHALRDNAYPALLPGCEKYAFVAI